VSRRIETGIVPDDLPKDALRLGDAKSSEADDYLGRLANYIPAEIVALYVATSNAVQPKNEKHLCIALLVVFLINFLLVPVYFWFATTREGEKPLWPQIVLATIAFPVWVFAIGGPFTSCFGWYERWMGSIVLAFVTVVFGFYKPAPGS
jgi:branched-subunit amino acid transport protein AzlD